MAIIQLQSVKCNKSVTKSFIRSMVPLLFLVPSLALAHPGHSLADSTLAGSILAGIVHPLTGIDHLMLALGMGVLFTQMKSFKTGFIALAIGLIAGFVLSLTFNLNSFYIESGIVVSIVLLTIALMTRTFNTALNDFSQATIKKLQISSAVAFGALAMFHGAAHAIEVPSNSITAGFFVGMIVAMLALYGIGKGLAAYLASYVHNYIVQRVMALIGLCAVLFS